MQFGRWERKRKERDIETERQRERDIKNIYEEKLPFIHPVVDEGVDTAVCHGQPVEEQVHVLDVRFPATRVHGFQTCARYFD